MTPLSNKQVGERIRSVRESKGITQTEVAQHLGMTKSNYAKYERGERRKIDREFLLNVAEVLGCNVAEINGLEDSNIASSNFEKSNLRDSNVSTLILKEDEIAYITSRRKLSDTDREFIDRLLETYRDHKSTDA